MYREKVGGRIIAIIIAVIFNFLSVTLKGQEQWGALRAGPFKVGYKTVQTIDYSRNYFSRGRPIQVFMWYPAREEPGQTSMSYGDYFNDVGKDWGIHGDSAKLRQQAIQDFMIGVLNPSFPDQTGEKEMARIMRTPIPVVRNPEPADGKFPVVLHMHGNGVLTQSVLMEYLASYGYIVMSISMYGSTPAFYARGEGSTAELLNLTEDLGVLLSLVMEDPSADWENIAVVGMLAQVGLSLQFKTKALKAIACADCQWNPALLKRLPYYDARAIRIPILELVNTQFASQNQTFLDSLPYSERYICRFREFLHSDFYPFPKIVSPAAEGKFSNYDLSAVLTRKFLDAMLKNDARAAEFLKHAGRGRDVPENLLSLRITSAAPPIPTEHEVLAWLRFGEVDKVAAVWRSYGGELVTENNMFFTLLFLIREGEPHALSAFRLYISEFSRNPRNTMLYEMLGNNLMQAGASRSAIEVFQHWVTQFPASPQAYLSLAKAYIASGDPETAEQELRRAQKLKTSPAEEATMLEIAAELKGLIEK